MKLRTQTIRRVNPFLIGVVLSWCIGLWMPRQVLALPDRQRTDLWFSLNVNPALVDWFNDIGGPQDIAWVGLGAADLLEGIQTGRRQIAFRSIEEAETAVPDLADKIDIVYYDLGPWTEVPIQSQDEMLGPVRRIRQLTRAHGLHLALGVDWRLASESGSVLASYADVIVLQAFRLQDDLSLVSDVILPLVEELRQGRPELEVGVQLRMDESLEQFTAVLGVLQDDVDGVSILYGPTSMERVQAFVEAVRSGEVDIGDGLLPPGSQAATPWFLTPEANGTPSPAVQPVADPVLPALRCTWPIGLVLGAGGWFVAGGRHQKRCKRESADADSQWR